MVTLLEIDCIGSDPYSRKLLGESHETMDRGVNVGIIGILTLYLC